MTTRGCVLLAAFTTITAVLSASQRPTTPTTGTASIAGVVLDGVTRKPVGGVRVSVSAENHIPNLPTALTDAAGSFTIGELPAGRYNVSVSKSGYLYSTYGQVSPGLPEPLRVSVEDGKRAAELVISIWREGAISGRVLGENGAPVIGVSVSAVQQQDDRYSTSGSSGGTNDRGEYRITRLAPGDYKIVAACTSESRVLAATPMPARWAAVGRGDFVPRGMEDWAAYLTDPAGRTILMPRCPLLATGPANQMRAYVSTAAGAPRLRDALSIALGAGEEREQVDVHLEVAPGTRVSGTITNPDGPVTGAIVELTPESWDGPSHLSRLSANAAPDGTFSFLMVPTGRYTLTAWRRQPPLSDIHLSQGAPVYPMDDVIGRDENNPWVQMTLGVGASPITDLALAFRTGTRVSGRIVDDGEAQPGVAPNRTVMFQRFDDRRDFGNAARVAADGTFSVRLVPGQYLVDGPRAARSRFGGAIVNGRNVGNGPIDVGTEDIAGVIVTTTRRLASLAGIVTGATTTPDATVVVFPVESEFWVSRFPFPGTSPFAWRVHKVRSRDGRFAFTDVLPGDYFVVAVETAAVPATITANFLESLAPNARRVTLVEQESRSVDLTVRSR